MQTNWNKYEIRVKNNDNSKVIPIRHGNACILKSLVPVDSDSVKAPYSNRLTTRTTTHYREFFFFWVAKVIKLLCHSSFGSIKYNFLIGPSCCNVTTWPTQCVRWNVMHNNFSLIIIICRLMLQISVPWKYSAGIIVISNRHLTWGFALSSSATYHLTIDPSACPDKNPVPSLFEARDTT